MLNERENILNALREKPLKVYEIMKRVNIFNEEACQSLLLKMRDDGLIKFDIHKGHWLDVVQVSRRISASLRTRAIPIKKCLRLNRLALQAMTCSPSRSCQFLLPGMVTN